MRTRTRTSVNNVTETYRQTDLVSKVVYWNSSSSVPGAGKSELIIDESDPSWYRAKEEGRILMRPMTRRTLDRKISKPTFHRESKVFGLPNYNLGRHMMDEGTNLSAGTYLRDSMLYPSGLQDTNHESYRDARFPRTGLLGLSYERKRLLEEAYADAGQSEALLPVSIAEFEKTLGSISRLRSLIPRFREWILANQHVLLSKRSAFRLSGEMARQWLEYRFGFMQLAYDLKSLDKAFRRIGLKYTTYSKRRVQRTSYPASIVTNTYPTDVDTITILRSRTDTITAGVVLETVPTCLDAIRALGLDKPLTTAWELTRLSWVVDRFIDVSTMLGAWEGALLRNVQGSWTSVKTECKATYTFRRVGRTYTTGNTLYQDCGTNVLLTDTEDYVQYVRDANPPYPWLLPEFKLKLNFAGALDLAALLRGLSTTLNPKR